MECGTHSQSEIKLSSGSDHIKICDTPVCIQPSPQSSAIFHSLELMNRNQQIKDTLLNVLNKDIYSVVADYLVSLPFLEELKQGRYRLKADDLLCRRTIPHGIIAELVFQKTCGNHCPSQIKRNQYQLPFRVSVFKDSSITFIEFY
jgi:hypothetical protein